LLNLTGFFYTQEMAENKKSFILYGDLEHTTKLLTDEEAGKVLKWLLSYVNDDKPERLSGLLGAVCEPIKQQMKRDLVKWDEIREKRSDAGKASALARKNKKKHDSTKPTHVESVEQTSTNPTVNDTVNVNVTVNEINKHPKGLEFFSDDVEFLEMFDKWITYRKQIKKQIIGKLAHQGQLNKLNKLSGGDHRKANNIILQSIENNWIGLIALKTETNDTTKKSRSRDTLDHNIEELRKLGIS
jgi:desulfoferrodoxin (superoxide reductase-like protein)